MELILILLALACAPYMLARMLRLPAPPSPAELWAAVSPAIGPAVELLGYLVKRTVAFGWEPTVEEKPALIRAWHYGKYESDEDDEDGVTAHQDAVKENAENENPAGPTPTELDKMLIEARHEATAQTIGRLVGAGILPADRRARALLAVGIEGRRYTRLKPIVDAAQSSAQGEPLPTETRTIGVSDRQDGQTIRREIRL